MEDPVGTEAESVVSPPADAPKSKLNALSKEDLIKFAKKQMAAFQKMKSRCADLEKEVATLKEHSKSSSDHSLLIQELTERMTALSLEKAETEHSLALSRKEFEKAKQLAKDDVTELGHVIEDHQRTIGMLKLSIEELHSKHQEEVAYFQKLLKEREDRDKETESEREKQRLSEDAGVRDDQEHDKCRLKVQLQALQAELETIQERNSKEIAGLQESHQIELTEAQQEVENLKEELGQRSRQHEEELRALEEDCEVERERLLLLQEELTEQLALKDGYLQDVQEEEDEESGRSSGIAKMLALSACSQADSSEVDGEATEGRQLRAALEDLQAQNTMLQDELTLLSNVKSELESELEKVKEEFQMEREEMDFKINELQMNRESDPTTMTQNLMKADTETTGSLESMPVQDQTPLNQDEQERLRSQCEALTKERDSALADFHHTRDILKKFETELGQKTNDFVLQYKAMKEQGANTLQNLQDKIEQVSQEKEELSAKVREVTEERDILLGTVQDLKMKNEGDSADQQQLQASAKQETALALESVEKLTKQNEEILSQLQIKETMVEELSEIVNTLTEKRDRAQSLLQHREEELQELQNEKAKHIEVLLEEKEAAQLLREETDRQLKVLKTETETEMQVLKEARDKMEESLKEEVSRMEEVVSSLQLTFKDVSADNACLQQKLDETLIALSQSQEERELVGSKLAAAEAQLEQQSSQKTDLETMVNSLREEAELAHSTMTELEIRSEALKNTKEEMQDLQIRLEELEKERNLLRSSLEEAQRERRLDEAIPNELQSLEEERNMLRANLQEAQRDTEGLQKDLHDVRMLSEKLCAENHTLQGRIHLMFQEKEEDGKSNTEKMERESREFKEQLMEKDTLISQLKSEMTALQDSAKSALSEESKVVEISQKLAELEKANKEKDEKLNKIKTVAVKAKKELDSSKKEVVTLKEEIASLKAERDKVNSSMKDIIHAAEVYKNLQIDYDKQTEQLDKAREKAEVAERQVSDLTKHLNSSLTQVDLLSSEKEDLLAAMETSRSTVRQIETQNQELQKQSASLDRDLVAERAMKKQKIKDLSLAMKEVEELTAQLSKQQQQSQQTAQELEHLRKEAQQNSLLDMEMADYERLVRELNAKISEKDESSEELKAQISRLKEKEETLKQEIDTLKSHLDQAAEKTSKIKQLLVKTKKDLSDAKNEESSLTVLQTSLRGELETSQQQLESAKIEVCGLTAECYHLKEQLRSAIEQHQRISSSLQQQIHSLQQDRDMVKAELVTTTEEFEGYKVRVHNVLKQQKSKLNEQNESNASRLEREQLSSQVDQLRSKLAENQKSLQSSTADLQQLQNEHDTLLERHNQILQENISKEAELRERLLSVQSENVELRSEVTQAQTDSSSNIEAQRQTYREQLRKLQDDHRATVETLQRQLTRVEEQLFVLQNQSSSVVVQSTRKSLDAQRRSADQNNTGLVPVVMSDLQSMAREECEGMETTENESSSPALLPSLEHLLTLPDPKQEPFVWTVEPTKEELSHKLNTTTRSLEHMNSLLHETEATNAVLMEQINLLKSEVRRLERNQEREKSVANLEYLKNVLLQFIFLQSGSERQALLPVIHTMLQLSPDEKSKLAAIAQGEEQASGNRGSGWSSYLHSWSGIR
ncbi:GRIP and coiled-coil domain-containing protein 2 [Dunckerocampus dactyliophorus]|uniref:GRIP and coiled-coil domain-containing protein 2 n=1 Tax=Dunckerocampus dactyliophorus TaxID=161453 RepID=UPI002407354A|nr:GRIP and coiled-coil domain-containing protein 2 [Dunckerocampus dactyliophorus]